MGIYIPNMERPESCWQCYNDGCDHWGEYGYDNSADCPLIEIDEEGIQKAKECLTVIKAIWRLFKIKVNESKELKQALLGMDSNLTIIDESYGERRSDENSDMDNSDNRTD